MPVTYCRAGETSEEITLTSPAGGSFTSTTTVEVEGGDCSVVTSFVAAAQIKFTVTPREDAATGDREIRVYDTSTNATPVVKTDIVSILRRGCLGSRIYGYTEVPSLPAPTGLTDYDTPLIWFLKSFFSDTGPANSNGPRIYLWDKADGEAFPEWWGSVLAAPDLHSDAATKESDAIKGYLSGAQSTWLDNLSNYTVARGVFPDEYVNSTAVVVNEKKWLGFPDPTTNCRLLTHPEDSFFRRPFYYMATPDYFWSKERLGYLGHAGGNPNITWSEQQQFGGLPLYYRVAGGAFNGNYGEPFKPLRDYEKANDMYFQSDPSGTEAKAVLVVSIELLELVAPGPRLSDDITGAGDLKQKYTYRRWPPGSSAKAKIRIYSQDMWAFKDFALPSGADHIIGEPICIAEAYCPRIDLTYDYNGWNSDTQPLPNSSNGLKPEVKGESFPFEWKETISDSSFITINDSDCGGVVGANQTQDKVYNVAKKFLAEFKGYRCRLVFEGPLAWSRETPLPASLPGTGSNCFTGRGPGPPHMPGVSNYADPILDREGTWVVPTQFYLEVVE